MTYLFNNNQQVYNTGTQLVQFVDETNTQLDAIGRLRVSTPTQSYWYTPAVDKDGDLRYIESFTGTNSTSTFVQNISAILFTSGTDSTGSAIRISRRRHKLRPNVSIQWQATGAFNGYDTNAVKRRGLFTQYNGVFFEVSNNTLSFVVRRRLIDGTAVEDRFPQSVWAYDKLDGSGPSKLNLTTSSASTFTLGSFVSKTTATISTSETHYDVVFNTASTCPYRIGSKVTISGFTNNNTGYNSITMVVATSTNTVTIVYPKDPGNYSAGHGTGIATQTGLHHEYTWWVDSPGDRSTRVRFGILTGGGETTCHMIDYTGQLGSQWSNAAAMPDRFEIYNTGTITILPTMTWGSTSINVESNYDINPGFGVAQTTSSITFNKSSDVGNEYAIVGIAIRSGEPYQRADLQVQRIQMTDAGNANPQNAAIFQWRLVLNPTLSSVPAEQWVGKATRMWNYAQGTTISGGTTLIGGYFQGTQIQDIQTALNFLNLGSNIQYTDSDKVILALKLITGGSSNSLVLGTINFIEDL